MMMNQWNTKARPVAALLICVAGLMDCKSNGADVSALTITPPPPLLIEQAAVAPAAPLEPVEPSRQAREIEGLLAMQAQRTEAQSKEALFWQAGAVVRWNEIARGLVAKYSTSPPVASRLYALLSVAQHDALVRVVESHRIHRRPSPASADPRVVPLITAQPDSTYPSDHAAVAAASAAILSYVYRSRAEVASLNKRALEHEASRMWAGISYPSDIEAGDRIGREVAEKVVEHAKADKSKPVLPWDGKVPVGKGMWFSSENPPASPTRPAWGLVRPWLMSKGSQFRPAPSPEIDSPEFARALNEVSQISRTRTPEQLRIAKFWADGPGSSTPPGHWNQIASDLITEHPRSEIAAARVLSFMNMAIMDAGISCWDAKYTYWVLRPSHADPTITTPVGLPNFPSYPSGHSTFSGAAAEVLGHFFPNEKERLAAMAEEASMSRVYGGIHYRFDGETGLAMGRSVGRLAIEKEQQTSGDAR
jgi:membrane-associated phospholipid phosphatase